MAGLVFLRVLESFNLSYRLRWLPRTSPDSKDSKDSKD